MVIKKRLLIRVSFILFIYNKYFINNYKLLYINSINYIKNINYMDELYKWIESNFHILKYEFGLDNNRNVSFIIP